MGRRQQRKKRRARERRFHLDDFPGLALAGPPVRAEEFLQLAQRPMPDMRCGRCREFVEDGEAGRGTCLHPASGVFAPWHDTPGCDYFRRV